ncbi:MAG: hypothetical protein OWU84_07815 [Firmicutes bacterium]|nr:hypothetical protein [Bacillota bacterium]
MNKKQPISFQARKRERRAKKSAPKRPASARAGEWDEVQVYWRQFLAHPFQGPGRLLWTERMLWGNSLLAGIATTLGIALEEGFHFLTLLEVFVNAFFLFFLAYYVVPWIADWVLRQFRVYQSSVDGIKRSMIVLSGWLVLVNLIRLIPWAHSLPYEAAFIAFFVLVGVALRRDLRAPGGAAALAALTSLISVWLILILLSIL